MAATLVVFDAIYDATSIWAWGRVEDDIAGFVDVTFTHTDGVTFVDVSGDPPRLGRYLFSVSVPSAVS